MVFELRSPFFLVVLLVSLIALGCREEPKIVSYEAPKDDPDPSLVEDDAPVRMLAAIVPDNQTYWFFKLTGDPKEVAEVSDAFQTFVTSTKIKAGKPQWNLPSGWNEKPGGDGIRYSTIVIPLQGKKLELAVTKLTDDGDRDEYLIKNVKRWRDQLSLPDASDSEVLASLKKVDREGQSPIYLCDLVGTGGGGAVATPPFASGGPFANSSAAGSGADSDDTSSVRVKAPDEWKPGQLVVERQGMAIRREAAYVVTDGDQQAEITVSSAMGGELENVQRWRGQLGLPRVQPQQLDSEKKTLEVAGKSASYVILHAPEGPERPQSILGVIVPRDGQMSWFIKMMGDSQLVLREQQRFEQFVRDIQFE